MNRVVSRCLSAPAATARQTRSGAGKPFALTGLGPRAPAARQAPAVRSPTSTSPGAAACCRRAAALTASPVTERSPARSSASTSPVSTPTRRVSPVVQRADPVPQGERRGDRAVGVVAVGARNSEHRHDGVADVLLDRSAMLFQGRSCDLEERRQAAAKLLRVEAPRPARSSRPGRRRRSCRACARLRRGRRAEPRTTGRSERRRPPERRIARRPATWRDDSAGVPEPAGRSLQVQSRVRRGSRG